MILYLSLLSPHAHEHLRRASSSKKPSSAWHLPRSRLVCTEASVWPTWSHTIWSQSKPGKQILQIFTLFVSHWQNEALAIACICSMSHSVHLLYLRWTLFWTCAGPSGQESPSLGLGDGIGWRSRVHTIHYLGYPGISWQVALAHKNDTSPAGSTCLEKSIVLDVLARATFSWDNLVGNSCKTRSRGQSCIWRKQFDSFNWRYLLHALATSYHLQCPSWALTVPLRTATCAHHTTSSMLPTKLATG